jgi:hypothetical protein
MRLMASDASADTFPAASRTWTKTCLPPAPSDSVQEAVAAKGRQADQAPVAPLRNRIWDRPLPGAGSVAAMVSVTALVVVAVAPLLIWIVPLGATVSRRIVPLATAELLPAASRNWTESCLAPSPAASV